MSIDERRRRDEENNRRYDVEAREKRARSRIRTIGAGVVLGLISFIALADLIAPFFGVHDLHVNEFVYGTLAGVFLLLIGIEVPSWLSRK